VNRVVSILEKLQTRASVRRSASGSRRVLCSRMASWENVKEVSGSRRKGGSAGRWTVEKRKTSARHWSDFQGCFRLKPDGKGRRVLHPARKAMDPEPWSEFCCRLLGRNRWALFTADGIPLRVLNRKPGCLARPKWGWGRLTAGPFFSVARSRRDRFFKISNFPVPPTVSTLNVSADTFNVEYSVVNSAVQGPSGQGLEWHVRFFGYAACGPD